MNENNKDQTYHGNKSYCKFGSEVLLRLLSILQGQISGVIKNDDIEYVHKTRVTSRRLRATLPLFKSCFRRKKYRKWICEIKKVTRLLSQARDLDVQILFVEKYMDKISLAEKGHFDLLLNNLKDLRRRIQPSVVSGLKEIEETDVLDDLDNFCEKISQDQTNVAFDSENVLAKARWHISFRLDDFMAMEKYVHLEKEVLKHHETRIYAKKLRYTMESFASLYKNRLVQEIEIIKAFQDYLGEMHDYDVWIDRIPKFIQEISAKNKSEKRKKEEIRTDQALLNFLAFVKEERKERYKEFAHFWDENKKKNFFVQLREKIYSESEIKNEKKIQQILAEPNVKIAVLSDIHANLEALEEVIQDAERRGASIFLNAGDSIGLGPYPNEVLELLAEKNVLSILGNYDLEVIEGKTKAKGVKNLALKFARKELAKSCVSYLKSLPRECRMTVLGKKLLVTHGSPSSINEHIYHDSPIEMLETFADDTKANVIIVGHSHEQFWRKVKETSFINPGSVGRPGDGNPQTAYGILSFKPFKFELIRLDYKVEIAAEALRKKGLPESFAQMLLRGVSLDTIIKEDQIKKDSRFQDCKDMTKASVDFSKKHRSDSDHYLQVRKIALMILDGSTSIHELGAREKCWLECAAILHDIGLSKSGRGHQKKSYRLILNDSQLPFTSEERRIIASITRFHRKALPKQNDKILVAFNHETIHKIMILAGILRIADSLDYSHQSIVEGLNIRVEIKRIILECISKTKSVLEEQAFNKKKDLFEKVFAKKMVLIWKEPSKTLDM